MFKDYHFHEFTQIKMRATQKGFWMKNEQF